MADAPGPVKGARHIRRRFVTGMRFRRGLRPYGVLSGEAGNRDSGSRSFNRFSMSIRVQAVVLRIDSWSRTAVMTLPTIAADRDLPPHLPWQSRCSQQRPQRSR